MKKCPSHITAPPICLHPPPQKKNWNLPKATLMIVLNYVANLPKGDASNFCVTHAHRQRTEHMSHLSVCRLCSVTAIPDEFLDGMLEKKGLSLVHHMNLLGSCVECDVCKDIFGSSFMTRYRI